MAKKSILSAIFARFLYQFQIVHFNPDLKCILSMPMQVQGTLSPKAIDEFIAIWKKQFNEDLPMDKAVEYGTQLLDLFRIVYKPIPKD